MKCITCGGEVDSSDDGYSSEQHCDKNDCIYVLQNTLNYNNENSKILEETIKKLINALDKIKKQEYNIATSYSIGIAKDALENL